jgi:hypothetical protein
MSPAATLDAWQDKFMDVGSQIHSTPLSQWAYRNQRITRLTWCTQWSAQARFRSVFTKTARFRSRLTFHQTPSAQTQCRHIWHRSRAAWSSGGRMQTQCIWTVASASQHWAVALALERIEARARVGGGRRRGRVTALGSRRLLAPSVRR